MTMLMYNTSTQYRLANSEIIHYGVGYFWTNEPVVDSVVKAIG